MSSDARGEPVPAWFEMSESERQTRREQIDNGVRHGYVAAEETLDAILMLEGPLDSEEIRSVGSLRRMANGSDLAVEIINELARHERDDVRQLIAQHPSTSQDVLISLLTDEDDFVRSYAAANPHLPWSMLPDLATSHDKALRFGVAGNPAATFATLAHLAVDPDPSVRQRLGRSGTAPLSLLSQLASDPSGEVLWGVARNPCITSNLAEQLFQSGNSDPLTALATNPNTPPTILERLASDGTPVIRNFVEENPSTPRATLEAMTSGHRYRFTSETVYRHVLLVPTEKDVNEIEVFYLTESLNSSVAEILDSPPDVQFSDPLPVEDLELVALYEDQLEPDTDIRIVEVTVWYSFRVQSPNPLSLQEFLDSLTWELSYENYDDELLDTITVRTDDQLIPLATE